MPNDGLGVTGEMDSSHLPSAHMAFPMYKPIRQNPVIEGIFWYKWLDSIPACSGKLKPGFYL